MYKNSQFINNIPYLASCSRISSFFKTFKIFNKEKKKEEREQMVTDDK